MVERTLCELTVTITERGDEFLVKVVQTGGVSGTRRFKDWFAAAGGAADLFKRFALHFTEAAERQYRG